jgi:hypothetical protein
MAVGSLGATPGYNDPLRQALAQNIIALAKDIGPKADRSVRVSAIVQREKKNWGVVASLACMVLLHPNEMPLCLTDTVSKIC